MKLFNLGKCVRIALSDRNDGSMKVLLEADDKAPERRANFLEKLNLTPESTAFVKVLYDRDDYCKFDEVSEAFSLPLSGDVTTCDGLVTADSGIGIFLPLADCLGVVLFDKNSGALMVVHCGRHTVLQEGAFKAVGFMRLKFGVDPGDIVVWLSPSAGKKKYPIYDLEGISLQEAVVRQLVSAGVGKEKIELSTIDTTSDMEYYSHSQGDTLNRFAICAVRSSK
jgi:Uncharacterized conserved protein